MKRAVGRTKSLKPHASAGGALLLLLCAAHAFVACRRSSPEELAAPTTGGAQTEVGPSAPKADILAPPSAKVERAALASGYDIPRRTDGEVRQLLGAACRSAQNANKPLLLEVGADWCSDCRLLHKMERAEPLSSAVASFEQVTLNLGDDAQDWLRDAFGVKAIARWLIFRPANCDAKVESWTPLASRVVEPASNGKVSNADTLVDWLEKNRPVR